MSGDQDEEANGGVLSGRWPLIVLAGLIVLSLGAICAIGYSLLTNSGLLASDGISPDGGSAEPTPFAQAVGGAAAAAGESIIYGISDNETISVTLDIPVAITVGGRDFVVLPQSINPDGTWSPGLSSDSAAGWVHGSIINYIVALQATGENEEFLQSLSPGTEMAVTTQGGSNFVFEVEGTRQVAADDQTVFSQLSPGLTLLLMGSDDEQRLVVDGRFVVADTTASGGAAEANTEVGLGEPVLLDGLQLTIDNATYIPDHPDTPPGFAYFILDGSLQNTSESTADIGSLQVVLVDEIGNRYVLNPIASRLGDSAPLTGGFLASGQSMPFSVGYQIPVGLSSTTLTAEALRQDTGAGVRIAIPFSASSAAEDAEVNLQSVEVSEDLTSLTLGGQITNTGGQPFVIAQSDITLRTPDGASYLILSSNPPFPWTVPAGQTLQYVMTFQRPLAADTAVFTVLNQPFQLNNIRE